MSQEPCTLFWPRSGFTPDALAADVAGGHREVGDAHDHRRALAVLGDAEAVVDRGVAARWRRAARRRARSAAGTPVTSAPSPRASCAARRRTRATSRTSSGSQRARTKSSSSRPSVTITCASALTTRDVGAGPQLQVVGGLDVRRAHQVDRRGSTTISFAPSRRRRFICEANTGWASVGLAPITMITSACSIPNRSSACRPTRRASASGRSRSANGRRARRCRRCCCRTRRAPASARGRFPRWCSATR